MWPSKPSICVLAAVANSVPKSDQILQNRSFTANHHEVEPLLYFLGSEILCFEGIADIGVPCMGAGQHGAADAGEAAAAARHPVAAPEH